MSEPGSRFPPGAPVSLHRLADEQETAANDAALFHTLPAHASQQLAAAAAAVPSTTDPALQEGLGMAPKDGRDECAQPTKRTFDCKYCGWRFTLKGNLLAHVRRHTGEKPYHCDICHRKFTQSSLLTVHMRTHTGEKPFKCESCGRTFSRSGNLHTHLRTHNDEKPYECAFCHKQFAQRVNMELHTRVHTGVKPYRCGVCDRAFTSCSNMRRHWRQIHPAYPEPAIGTTHLQNGMPEKALYNVDIMRMPMSYRAEEARMGQPRPELARELPLLRENTDIYAPMLPTGLDAISSTLGQYGMGSVAAAAFGAPDVPPQMHALPLEAHDEFDPAIKEEEALATAAAAVQRS